jgi:CRP-like cAMP-binding protein
MSETAGKLTIEQVAKIPFFRGLEDDELEDLSSFLNLYKFKKYEMILREGDKAQSMYFIIEGSVKILKKSNESSDEIVGFLNDPDFFGEMALIDGEERSATVIAQSDLLIAELRWDSFQETFSSKPEIIIYVLANIAKTLSLRLRSINASYANIATGFKGIV